VALLDDAILVALGGNAIARQGDDGSIAMQYQRAAQAMREVAALATDGAHIVLTHGNGPVVGDIMRRAELAAGEVPPTPLFIADADSEGGIGLMLQQVLGNELRRRGSSLLPVTVVTQVVVDRDDPGFRKPTKPIGACHTEEEADRLTRDFGWTLAEEPGRGWRRVVASPRPVRVVEAPAIAALAASSAIPIAAGGGGVPVIEDDDGTLRGVDAVIDKDWSAALLAHTLGATTLVILMEAHAILDGFGGPKADRIERLTASEALDLSSALPPGSVGPKVAAAAWFASRGGCTLIGRAEDLPSLLTGDAGTRIVPAKRPTDDR
jgi:carbamate kinase